MKKVLFSIIALITLAACDGGLEPYKTEELSYIRGRIYYKNGREGWPPKDSVIEVRVVAFKNFASDSIYKDIISGNAIYTNSSTAMFVDSADFEIEVKEAPLTFNYIVVAQRYGSLFDWRAIGVYTVTGDVYKPSKLDVEKGKSYFITMNVDFNNLPPQPF